MGNAIKLQRGSVLSFEEIEVLIEYHGGTLLLFSVLTEKEAPFHVGEKRKINGISEQVSYSLELQIIAEQRQWPVILYSALVLSLSKNEKQEKWAMVKPDYILTCTYHVMGRRLGDERREAVILAFSPQSVRIGTDGFLAVGEFVRLSFVLPRIKQEFTGMAKVIDKKFENQMTEVDLEFTDLHPDHIKTITKYYQKLK